MELHQSPPAAKAVPVANTRRTFPSPGSGEKERYFVDGKEVSQKEYDRAVDSRLQEALESREGPGGHHPSCWPMPGSNALMVHPNQLREAQERAAAAGVPTEFDQHCRPIFRDRDHRKRYCALEGIKDRSGGYSDRT